MNHEKFETQASSIEYITANDKAVRFFVLYKYLDKENRVRGHCLTADATKREDIIDWITDIEPSAYKFTIFEIPKDTVILDIENTTD